MPAERVADQTGQHRQGGKVARGADLIDRYAAERHERRLEAQNEPAVTHDLTVPGRVCAHVASSASGPLSDCGTVASIKHNM